MTSVGTGYDLAASTFSPEGRLFQVEYAGKAVDSAPTIIGLRVGSTTTGKCTVIAVEKMRSTRLLRPGRNNQITVIDGIALVSTGLLADGEALIGRAREEITQFKRSLNDAIPVDYLASQLAFYCQQHTLYSSIRPFGACLLIGSPDGLFQIDPNGQVWGCHGASAGRSRQYCRTELERIVTNGSGDVLNADEAVKQAIKILTIARLEDPAARERPVELEVVVVEDGKLPKRIPLTDIHEMVKQATEAHTAAMDFEEI